MVTLRLYVCLIVVALAAACGNVETSRNSTANDSPHGNHAATAEHSNTADPDKGHTASDHSKMESSPGAADAPYELQFIDTMTAHHQGAIDMAELAASRAGHPELKELAQNIINDQEREVAKMSAWREEWFAERPKAINMELPGMREGMHGMDTKKLEALKGNEFDLEFIRQMIPHHEGAIKMARDGIAKAPPAPSKNKELAADFRSFLEDIADAQTQEIEQMRKWLAEWIK